MLLQATSAKVSCSEQWRPLLSAMLSRSIQQICSLAAAAVLSRTAAALLSCTAAALLSCTAVQHMWPVARLHLTYLLNMVLSSFPGSCTTKFCTQSFAAHHEAIAPQAADVGQTQPVDGSYVHMLNCVLAVACNYSVV